MYSGVITVDGNRIRFAVKDWKTMLALKLLGTQIREMLTKSFRNPGRKLFEKEMKWFDTWQQIFSQHLAVAPEVDKKDGEV
jgi:ATP-dependent RNA helicase DHX29